MKPLNGLKVIDLTHMLAGPYAGMVLADLGAEVVKVEPLNTGEMTRGLLKNDPNYSFKNFGAYFLTLNRNKKSVSIDLKNEKGLDVFYYLVRSADIVLNNFSAGVVKKLQIDFEHLSKVNPKIIKDQAMKPKKLGILILFSSAIALTMKLGALPMYVNAPINTAPHDIATSVGLSVVIKKFAVSVSTAAPAVLKNIK